MSKDQQIREIVAKMYVCGTNNRALKHGHPESMIQDLLNSKKDIDTIGVFIKLPKKYQDLIHLTKDNKKLLEHTDMCVDVARIILENTEKADCGVFSTQKGMEVLKGYANKDPDYLGKFGYVFNLRTIFLVQERQKLIGNVKR